MIKSGEVAFLKTTGESVFVLSFADNDPSIVFVRRPVAGQNGIEHRREQFFLDELESLDEQETRFVTGRKKIMEKYGPKDYQQPSVEDLGFGPN